MWEEHARGRYFFPGALLFDGPVIAMGPDVAHTVRLIAAIFVADDRMEYAC